MKLICIFLTLIFSTSISANEIKYTCEVQSPCRYASTSDLGECVNQNLTLTIFGRSLKGSISSILNSHTIEHPATFYFTEDEMSIISNEDNNDILIETYKEGSNTYKGSFDYNAYVFNIICGSPT